MLPLPGSRYAKRALITKSPKVSKDGKNLSASSGRLRELPTAKRAGPATPLRRMPAIQRKGYPTPTTLQLPALGSAGQNPLPERLQAGFRGQFHLSEQVPDCVLRQKRRSPRGRSARAVRDSCEPPWSSSAVPLQEPRRGCAGRDGAGAGSCG